jgi:hypothetical protein
MLRLLPGIIASSLAAFAGIYGQLWFVCYISDHDGLVMLHMYYSPIILSVAFGIIVPLTSADILDRELRVQSGQNLMRHMVVMPRFQFAIRECGCGIRSLQRISRADRDGWVTLRSSLVCRFPHWNSVLVVISRPLALTRLTCRGRQ